MQEKYNYYYDAMEALDLGKISMAKRLLQKALDLDIEFIDAYNGLTSVYEDQGNKEMAKKCAGLAFDLTRKMFPNWPKNMHWGELDNRQYLRAICNEAIYLHEEGRKKEAESLYKLLLELNPNDNQGVRYLLAALFSGEKPEIVDGLDYEMSEKLLDEQNKKHKFWNEPEEDMDMEA